MCGINGFNFKDLNLLRKMSNLTSSRGPDNEGFFLNHNYSVAHNRLSIIDVEKRSNQPFKFENLVISYNGEIYNYLDLSNNLKNFGYSFETTSDTEVIIKLFHKYGENSFKMLSGIFAFSIYDEEKDTFYLVRDVIGVKPLYYYYDQLTKKFYFSSLIKSLLASNINKELNLSAVRSYANFNRNDLRETYFKKIFKVLPGEMIKVSKNEFQRKKVIELTPNQKVSTSNIKRDIEDTFSKQFISDVPVAVSLSGGVDSNLIFSEMHKKLGDNFTSYSVNFKDSKKYNVDHDYAKKISNKFGVKFFSIETSFKDFINRAEDVVNIVEEPTGNTNSIANLVLSENISEKVLFSGDGGDEVFTGYDKYRSISLLSKIIKINFLKSLKINFNSKSFKRLFIDSSKKLYLSFSEQNLFQSQKKIYKNFQFFEENELDNVLNNSKKSNFKPELSNVMAHDLDTWVVNDILLRNDKIYSNKGIELRVPFLDKDLIKNYLMATDLQKFGYRFRNKNLLIKSFKKELSETLKKKYGFNTPFAGWLRSELYEYAKSVLSKEYYDSSSIIDLDECQKLLDLHKKKYYDPFLIWNVINLQIFLRKFKI